MIILPGILSDVTTTDCYGVKVGGFNFRLISEYELKCRPVEFSKANVVLDDFVSSNEKSSEMMVFLVNGL